MTAQTGRTHAKHITVKLDNSSGTLTLGLNNAGGQTINGTHDKIWLLIRYKGTPSNTLEKITVSTS